MKKKPDKPKRPKDDSKEEASNSDQEGNGTPGLLGKVWDAQSGDTEEILSPESQEDMDPGEDDQAQPAPPAEAGQPPAPDYSAAPAPEPAAEAEPAEPVPAPEPTPAPEPAAEPEPASAPDYSAAPEPSPSAGGDPDAVSDDIEAAAISVVDKALGGAAEAETESGPEPEEESVEEPEDDITEWDTKELPNVGAESKAEEDAPEDEMSKTPRSGIDVTDMDDESGKNEIVRMTGEEYRKLEATARRESRNNFLGGLFLGATGTFALGVILAAAGVIEKDADFDSEVDLGYELSKDGKYSLSRSAEKSKVKVLVPETERPGEFLKEAFRDLVSLQSRYDTLKRKFEGLKENPADLPKYRELQTKAEQLEAEKKTLKESLDIYQEESDKYIEQNDVLEREKSRLETQLESLNAQAEALRERKSEAEQLFSDAADLGTYFGNGVSSDYLDREGFFSKEFRDAVNSDFEEYTVYAAGSDRLKIVTSSGEVHILPRTEEFDSGLENIREHLAGMDRDLDKTLEEKDGRLRIRFTGRDLFADIYRAVYEKDPSRQQAIDMRSVVEEKVSPDMIDYLRYNLEPGSEVAIRLK